MQIHKLDTRVHLRDIDPNILYHLLISGSDITKTKHDTPVNFPDHISPFFFDEWLSCSFSRQNAWTAARIATPMRT